MFSSVERDWRVQPLPGELVLLPVDRQVIAVLVRHDLGRDARVVAVPFDQSGRRSRLPLRRNEPSGRLEVAFAPPSERREKSAIVSGSSCFCSKARFRLQIEQ